MRPIRRSLRLGAAAAVLFLAGCAPGFGPGLRLGLEPTGRLSLGASPCFLSGSAYAAPHGMSRLAGSAFSFGPKIARLQARYSLGYTDVAARQGQMKQIATGDC